MYVIGFYNGEYNLWFITKEYKIEGEFRNEYNIYNYIKTISKDLSEVTKLYPTAKIDPIVNNYDITKQFKALFNSINIYNIFPNGKYKGNIIDECNDIIYLKEYINTYYFNSKYNIYCNKIIDNLKSIGTYTIIENNEINFYDSYDFLNYAKDVKIMNNIIENKEFNIIPNNEMEIYIDNINDDNNRFYILIDRLIYIFNEKINNIVNKQIFIFDYNYKIDNTKNIFIKIYVNNFTIKDRT